jgi:hypothetical protein
MPPQGMGYGPRRIIPRMPLGARPMPGQGMPRPMQRPPFPKDKELDDTLKKLKDMSK